MSNKNMILWGFRSIFAWVALSWLISSSLIIDIVCLKPSSLMLVSAWSLRPIDKYGPGSRARSIDTRVERVSLSEILHQSTGTFHVDDEEEPDLTVHQLVHHYFMNQALVEARQAGKRGEVPIGAIVVHNYTTPNNDPYSSDDASLNTKNWSEIMRVSDSIVYEIESRASNQVEEDFNAAAHAELLALQQAAAQRGNWRLLGSTLYSTLEPCPMCLAASLAFRVDQIVYGAPDLRLGAIVTNPTMSHNPHPFHNVSNIVGNVQRNESAALLRSFFRQRRRSGRGKQPETEAGNKINHHASQQTSTSMRKGRRRNPLRILWRFLKSILVGRRTKSS